VYRRSETAIANYALTQTESKLGRAEYQLMCILQLQLQHALATAGHLPQLDAD
jgi:hypothetical protein